VDTSQLILRAAKLSWREKQLWLFAFVAGLGATAGDVGRSLLVSRLSGLAGDLGSGSFRADLILEKLLPASGNIGVLVLLVSASLIVATLLWLLATWAEGAIVASLIRSERGIPASFGEALEWGRRLLGRFVAIDAFVFLPLFLLLLFFMCMAMGAVVGAAFMWTNGPQLQTPAQLVATAAACATPVVCVLTTFSLITTTFRSLAFREAAFRTAKVRDSLRRTMRLVRRNAGVIVVFLALLWGVRYLFGLVIGFFNLLLLGAAGTSNLLALGDSMRLSPPTVLVVRLLSLVHIPLAAIGRAILYTFVAAAWTLIYGELVAREQPAVEAAHGTG
jgi:hypothetical protein